MLRLGNTIKSAFSILQEIVLNEERRRLTLFRVTYLVLALVSLFMSIVNVFTGEIVLLISTAVFSVACFIDFCLCFAGHKGVQAASWLFIAEVPALMLFFGISGHPDGFSIIWSALLPTCGLLLYGTKKGSILSGIIFSVLAFLFWTPWGRGLLMFNYGETFMLRFPMLYLSFFALALVLEVILHVTQQAYADLCRHDPLTGAYNRQGFTDTMQAQLHNPLGKCVGFIIADLDRFKLVNDTYGHFAGDKVLSALVRVMKEVTDAPVCRWGGEEFAIFVPDGAKAEEIAEEIRSRMAALEIKPDDHTVIHQTVSLGVVSAELTGFVDPNWLCRKADECLYEAKDAGRNRVVSRKLATSFELLQPLSESAKTE